MDSNQEVLINETYLTDIKHSQQGQSSGIHLFIFFLKIFSVQKFYMLWNKFLDFKNPIVLHNVIFNMNATSEIAVRIVTGLKILLL